MSRVRGHGSCGDCEGGEAAYSSNKGILMSRHNVSIIMPRYMSRRNVSTHMSEHMPEHMSEQMPHHMSEHMTAHMSEQHDYTHARV